MRKRGFIRAVAAITMAAAMATTFAFTGCGPKNDNNTTKPPEQQQPTPEEPTAAVVTFKVNGGKWSDGTTADKTATCDENGVVPPPSNPVKDEDGEYTYQFKGWAKSATATDVLDLTKEVFQADGTLYAIYTATKKQTLEVTFDANGGKFGDDLTQVIKCPDGKLVLPEENPTDADGKKFVGWTLDKDSKTLINVPKFKLTASVTLYAVWYEQDGQSFESVTTNVDLLALQEMFPGGNTNKLKEDYTVGAVTFSAGVYFDDSSSQHCVNNQQKAIYFNLQGAGNGNSIKFSAKGAGSGKLKLYKQDGTVLKDYGTVTSAQDFEETNLEAGVYYLQSEGSCRLYNISYTQNLEKGAPVSMEVKAGETDILIGKSFSVASLNAQVTYINEASKTQVLTSANIDVSGVNTAKAGTYTVKVSYTEMGITVTDEYEVTVHALNGVRIGTFRTNGNKQTTFKTLYVKGGTFSKDGLTVTGLTSDQEITFNLAEGDYTMSTVDLGKTGTQTLTISLNNNLTAGAEVKTGIDISVVEAAAAVENKITISVDKSAEVSSSNFHTITDALSFLSQCNLDQGVEKIINIADGEYNEKVFVDMPNVHFVGSDEKTCNHETDNGVVIVYDAIAGKSDAAGNTFGTNGSGTVTISSNAKNFVAENITFKNHYNTNALYKESLLISSDSQAVALLVESERATFKGCKLTSYHDTLYSNKGYHYYEKCWIEGHTDYIFGQDARAYFNDCDIYSLGAGAEEANGGYVTALKPTSAAADMYFVYNNCRFNADENTKDGSVALGRAWGAEMKMAVINCRISAKFSKEAHVAGKTQSQRYCTMSGNEPKAANMLEYGNTGDGAISASIENTCTYLTEAQAQAYMPDNLTAILGWNPLADYTVTIHVDAEEFELGVAANTILTAEKIKSALGATYSSSTIEGVYTDAALTEEYDYAAVTSDLDLYVKIQVDLTITEDCEFNFGKGAGNVYDGTSALFGKMQVNGLAVNGDWYKFTADGTLKIKVNANTLIEVAAYEGGTITFEGGNGQTSEANVNGLNMHYYFVTEACEITIKPAVSDKTVYVGYVKVDVDATGLPE